MKKILLAFDGTNFSEGAFEFARRLNEIEPLLLTGVFVPQVDYANLWSYAAAANSGVGLGFVPLVEEPEGDLVKMNIQHFEDLCRKNGIAYRVHKDFFSFALPELKKESRFTDVVILGGEQFYKGVIDSMQFEYLRDALHASESPVLIVPEKFEFPESNIIAYNGSEDSVFALKQFAYIFPELAKNPTLLVYAQDNLEKQLPSEEELIELVTQHYKNLTVEKLELNRKKFFLTWIAQKKSPVLISGSFSRSAFSQTLKKSFVADVIAEHRLPVFVAHR